MSTPAELVEAPRALDLLTSSRAKEARACQYRHKLLYIDGYRSVVQAEALRFGTLFHSALEAWWRAPVEERLEAALMTLWKSEAADAFEKAKAVALIHGYNARWSEESLELVAVEKEFRIPLVNPLTGRASRTWELGGKVDVVVRQTTTGRLFLMEHKTAGVDITPGSDYWKRLKMDGQISIYFEGARSLGYDIEGCLYDVIGKPALRPLKATPVESRKYTKTGELYKTQRLEDETPEAYGQRIVEAITEEPLRYFARGDVVRLEAETRDAMWDLWQLAQQLHEAKLAGRSPRNPDACVRYGRTCEFFGVCCGEDTLDNTQSFTRSDNVHPELNVINE